MTHADIVNKVKSILNEHGEVDAVSIDEDRVLLEDYIESAIPDAVIMLAQKGYRVNVATTDTRTDDKIMLPEGFISLLSVKLASWKKTITGLTEVGSPEYVMAMNEYTAPGVNTPVCYKDGCTLVCLPDEKDDKGAYDVFKLESNVEHSKGENESWDDVNLCAEPKEATAVCYMAAALVLGMFGDDTGKQRLSDVATNMLS